MPRIVRKRFISVASKEPKLITLQLQWGKGSSGTILRVHNLKFLMVNSNEFLRDFIFLANF